MKGHSEEQSVWSQAELRVTWPQEKEGLELPEPVRGEAGFTPEPPWGARPSQHLDFRVLPSQPVGECISIDLLCFFWCATQDLSSRINRPKPTAVRAQSPNHWTAREFPHISAVFGHHWKLTQAAMGKLPRGRNTSSSSDFPLRGRFGRRFICQNRTAVELDQHSLCAHPSCRVSEGGQPHRRACRRG